MKCEHKVFIKYFLISAKSISNSKKLLLTQIYISINNILNTKSVARRRSIVEILFVFESMLRILRELFKNPKVFQLQKIFQVH